jgi:hypothetical protein
MWEGMERPRTVVRGGCVSKFESKILDAGLLNTRMGEWVGIFQRLPQKYFCLCT